jgi:hypothetical protein
VQQGWVFKASRVPLVSEVFKVIVEPQVYLVIWAPKVFLETLVLLVPPEQVTLGYKVLLV